MHRSLQQLTLTTLIALGLAGCASGPDRESRKHSEAYDLPVASESDKATRLWDVFARYEGTPYRYGGSNGRGFDCSGFIGRAYSEAFGVELPRTTSQLLANGDAISRDQLQAGDLVFFEIRGKEQHAGIFMGDDRFIHSSTSVGVTQSSMSGFYWSDRFTQARRFD